MQGGVKAVPLTVDQGDHVGAVFRFYLELIEYLLNGAAGCGFNPRAAGDIVYVKKSQVFYRDLHGERLHKPDCFSQLDG